MPLSDLPLTVLVSLFLTIFVLIGIQPALKRAARKLRRWRSKTAPARKPAVAPLSDVHADLFSEPLPKRPLNDFEIIVIRRLAQASNKALTRKEVNEPLLFGSAILQKTLQSLHRRGLIQVSLSTLFGQRFRLSKTGRSYALEQGYLMKIRSREGRQGVHSG